MIRHMADSARLEWAHVPGHTPRITSGAYTSKDKGGRAVRGCLGELGTGSLRHKRRSVLF